MIANPLKFCVFAFGKKWYPQKQSENSQSSLTAHRRIPEFRRRYVNLTTAAAEATTGKGEPQQSRCRRVR